MIDLTSKIEATQLKLEGDTIKKDGLNIFNANYFYSNGIHIAKYIIVSCDANSFREHVLEKESFVREFIEPVFYQLRSDLSWNLYLVCVLDDTEYNKLSYEETIRFSSNKDYTRNVIIRQGEFESQIPVGKIVSNEEIIAVENPIEKWQSMLSYNHLEFCLDGFSSQYVEDYANGHSDGIHYIKIPQTPGQVDCIEKINKINVTEKFRPDCYGRVNTFETKAANLLSGANGTGKTTLLQAIESVLTGEVRIGNNNKTGDDAKTGVNIEYNNGEILKPCIKPAEKKDRERSWYNNRAGTNTKVNLNEAFHLYNYFSTEDTFLFAFLGDQPKYDDVFTKLIFGEEVKTAERAFGTYKDKFAAMLSDKEKLVASIEEELFSLEKIESIDKNELVQRLEKLQIKYNPNANLTDWQTQVVDLQNECILIKDINTEITNVETLSEAFSSLKSLEESVMNGFDEVQEGIKKLEEELASAASECEKQKIDKDKIEADFISYENSFEKIEKLIFVNTNLSDLESLASLKERSLEVFAEVKMLEPIYSEYNDLRDVEQSYHLICDCANNLLQLISQKDEGTNKLCQVTTELEKLAIEQNQLDNTISNIRSYGKTYIETVEDFKSCPLCGNDKITRDEFVEFLDSNFEISNIKLQELQSANDSLALEIEGISKKIDQARFFEKLKKRVDDAYERCAVLFPNDQECEKLDRIKELLETFDELTTALDNSKRTHDFLLKQIRSLNPAIPMSENELDNYINVINATELSTPNFDIDKNLPVKQRLNTIIAFLSEKKSGFESMKSKNAVELKNSNAYIETVKTQIEALQTRLERFKNEIAELQIQKNELKRLEMFFNNIIPIMKIDVTNFYHTEIFNQCDELINKLNSYQKSEETSKRVAEQKLKLEKNKMIINNCKKAYDTLSKLKPSREFAVEFIEQHIKHISAIFCSLHTPKEFDALELINKKLVGIRNGSEADITQMSTGQKTALVLSVFIALNSAVTTAPKFILLDEPVANIDDLNILSLLDFLREMVITNQQQIFFTTANYNVKKLFRRKFSFLKDELVEFEFNRIDSKKTNVTVNQYVPAGMLKEPTVISF